MFRRQGLTWDGLGQPLLQHTSKQRSVLFPQPPSSSGLKVEIGCWAAERLLDSVVPNLSTESHQIPELILGIFWGKTAAPHCV